MLVFWYLWFGFLLFWWFNTCSCTLYSTRYFHVYLYYRCCSQNISRSVVFSAFVFSCLGFMCMWDGQTDKKRWIWKRFECYNSNDDDATVRFANKPTEIMRIILCAFLLTLPMPLPCCWCDSCQSSANSVAVSIATDVAVTASSKSQFNKNETEKSAKSRYKTTIQLSGTSRKDISNFLYSRNYSILFLRSFFFVCLASLAHTSHTFFDIFEQ